MYVAAAWACVIDLPTRITIGSISASALMTLGAFLLTLFMTPAFFLARRSPPPTRSGRQPFLTNRFRVSAVPWPLACFLAWAGLSLVANMTAEGLQNVAVYGMFAGSIIAVATSSTAGTALRTQRILVSIGWLASIIEIVGLAKPEYALYNARSFALTALIIMAATIPDRSRARAVRLLPYVLFLIIALGLSRSALAAAGVVLTFVVLRGNQSTRLLRGLGLNALALASLWWLAQHYQPLRDRFLVGDAGYQVNGVAFNTSGRSEIWRGVLRSIHQGDSWLGQGAGSAASYVARTFVTVTQPHNEYLRLWHDFGLIGLGLFVVGYLMLAIRAMSFARRSTGDDARVHWSAFLGLIVVALVAVTDNVFIYPFVMIPLGVMVGLSVANPPIELDDAQPAAFSETPRPHVR